MLLCFYCRQLKSKAIDIPSLAAIHFGLHFVLILNNSKFMVSLTSEKTGWLNRYLSYRAKTPFVLSEQYQNLNNDNSSEEILDDCLYIEVKENGILLGCPVITESLTETAEKLDFPQQRGGTILLYLETLFSVAMIENQILTLAFNNDSSDSYQLRLLNILMLVLIGILLAELGKEVSLLSSLQKVLDVT